MPPDLQELENELKKDPKLRRFYELAREYQKRGRLDEAAVWCEKGLTLNPSQWQARILLAQVYLAKGRVPEARAQVEKVLLPLPDNIPANHLAADIYMSLGESEKALRHYQVVELFDPGRAGVKEKIQQLTVAEEVPPPQEAHAEAAEAPGYEVQPLEEPAEPAQKVAPAVEEEPAASIPGPEALVETAEVTPPEAEVLEVEALEEEPQAAPVEPQPEAEATALSLEIPVEEGEEMPIPQQPEEAWDVATDTFEQEILQVPAGQPAEESGGFNTAELSRETEESFREFPEPGAAVTEEPQAVKQVPHEVLLEEAGEAQEGPEEAFLEQALAPEVENAPAFSTATLAELYEGQGYPEKAVEVYQRLLLKDPDNVQIRERVSRLMMRMAGEAPEGPAVRPEDVQKAMRQKRVMHLNSWLRRVREARHV